MSASLLLNNLGAYSLQFAAIALVGAVAARLIYLESPYARLTWWQILLTTCVLAPVLGPWRPAEAIGANVSFTTMAVALAPAPAQQALTLPWREILIGVVACGALLRLAWLSLGLWRLHRYRLCSEPWRSDTLRFQTEVSIAISDEIAGPVTFGVLRPLILLPRRFIELKASEQEAVLCHELVHVERRDWAWTLVEEALRSVLWFHPAMWWLLAQIQLSREQAVDHRAVKLTADRRTYLDALVSVASRQPELELVTAPSFLIKHHLSRRVASLLEEVSMSKKKLAARLTALCGLALLAGVVAVRAFPLQAAPQAEEPKVEVKSAGLKLLHSTNPVYPLEAKMKGIQGQVVLELQVNQKGIVEDAQVLSGPNELRKSALQAVLDWHFAPDPSLPARTQVTLDFTLPPGYTPPTAVAGPNPRMTSVYRPIKQIDLSPLPESIRAELAGRLPVHLGDQLDNTVMQKLLTTAREVDEHMVVGYFNAPEGVIVRMSLKEDAGRLVPFSGQVVTNDQARLHPTTPGVPQLRVGGNVQATKLVQKVAPMYPPEAKQARIQGLVRVDVLIDKQGAVKDIQLVSGHPLLAEAAVEAVKQWKYETTLLNGEPVEVIATIDVNFTLSQ